VVLVSCNTGLAMDSPRVAISFYYLTELESIVGPSPVLLIDNLPPYYIWYAL